VDYPSELLSILACGYLRLLTLYGHNWLENKQLRQERKSEESAENLALRLDFPANRSQVSGKEA